MGLILRQQLIDTNPSGISVTGSAISYAQADSNFIYLLTNMSGSSLSLTGNNINLTGDINTTGTITMVGSQQMFGTASWAVNAISASYINSANINSSSPNRSIQFNDNGDITGSASLIYSSNGTLLLGGVNSNPSGPNSLVIPYNEFPLLFLETNVASNCLSVGSNNNASAASSVTLGQWLISNESYQTIIGQYNIPSTAQSAFIIGNGTSDLTRSNLLHAAGNRVQITGSLNVLGNQTITGSLTITNNLTVLGSASIQYISESQLNIGTNLITVNTFGPSVRFGGLAVIDSGSSPQTSGSFLYDSVNDNFIFVHKGTGGNITSSVFLLGPESSTLGNETYLALNSIPKGTGTEHLNNSNISDDGSAVSINSNTQITGSLVVSQAISASSFSGSFIGTFSGSGANLFDVPASGVVGLNLSQITSGSVSASISPNNGLQVNTNVTATSFTGSLFGTASWATSASWAPMRPAGSDTQIQFNSGSVFSGSATFRFIYANQSLQHGENVLTIGLKSHAEGHLTATLGSYSHAEGYFSIASGSYSHAEGASTTAIGEASHTAGWQTVASGAYQSVIGQYNVSSSAESAFIIGNGADDSNRSNLLFAAGNTVQITGSLNVSGSITGSLFGTASWANNATTSSYILNAVSSSFAQTASYVLNAISSSFASTASYVLNAVSSSFASTASFVQNAQSASYVLNAISSSFASTASYVLNAISSSYAQTASFAPAYLPLTGGTINGDVILNGTASIAFLNVTYESASVIYSSGSNQLGDAINDTQTLIGTVIVSGSQQITGSLAISGSTNAMQIENGWIVLTQVSTSLDFANDTAAAAGGVPLGGLYRNGNAISIRII